MNKWMEIIIGLILTIGTILIAFISSIYNWVLFGKNFNLLYSAWVFFKGGIFWLILLIGFLLIVLGINDLKE